MTSGRVLRVWGSLGGLAFVVLFVIGSILIFDGPNGDEPPAKYLDFYGDGGNRDKINIGWVLAGLGVFFFLWFVAALRETVRKATVASDESMLGFLVTIGGAAYGAVTLVALGEAAGVRTMSDDTFQHEVFPGIIHANERQHLHRARDRDGRARGDDLRLLDHRPRNAGAAALDRLVRTHRSDRGLDLDHLFHDVRLAALDRRHLRGPVLRGTQRTGSHAERRSDTFGRFVRLRKRAARGTRRQWESSRSHEARAAPAWQARAATIPPHKVDRPP